MPNSWWLKLNSRPLPPPKKNVRPLSPFCCLDLQPFQGQEANRLLFVDKLLLSGAYANIKSIKTIIHFETNLKTVLESRTQFLFPRVPTFSQIHSLDCVDWKMFFHATTHFVEAVMLSVPCVHQEDLIEEGLRLSLVLVLPFAQGSPGRRVFISIPSTVQSPHS